MAKTYRIGRAYELEVKEMFEKHGYDVCLATNSKGTWDLVATRIHEGYVDKCYYAVMVQCKRRASRAKKKGGNSP